jgi:glutamate formiminotransferase
MIAVPNVSEGRDARRIDLLGRVAGRGARLLDVHSDPAHHRSVFTVVGSQKALVHAMSELAATAARHIDLRTHDGVHPRLGGLDVCPFVASDGDIDPAVRTARNAADAIARRAGLPVYLYEAAAIRAETRALPDLRRGGLASLIERARRDLPPDAGPAAIDPATGVVCVGARGVLIAFNVWLRGDLTAARLTATRVRSATGGPPGIRALGLATTSPGVVQVSMNLTEPETTGIDDAFEAVSEAVAGLATPVATEVVGLVPARYLPDPDKQAARLLVTPGRSLEAVLGTS